MMANLLRFHGAPRLAVALVSLVCASALMGAQDQPNILWLTSEDHGPHLGCYGDRYATTPHLDALAKRGMRFAKCWSNGPVCAAARTTLISGLYPPSSGGEHMRSMLPPPANCPLYPQLLRKAGYYCTNNNKEDYNLGKPADLWDQSNNKAHWKNAPKGKPFFAIFNETCSHESQLRKRPHLAVHDPAKVRLPAYHPDTPEVRQDWAQYYDQLTLADASAGRRLAELEQAGLADNTIVFYYSDHGSGMPRHKRWPGNSGLHVPLIVYFPPKWRHLAPAEYQEGGVSQRLVSFVDMAPTLLSLLGQQPPAWMQGHAFAGPKQSKPQPFLFGFRGRMDECLDCVRSVTDGRFVYLRNFAPHLSSAQHLAYQFETPTTRVWQRLFAEGRCNAAQSLFWQPKAAEELYDLQSDPDEVHNLAADPGHQDQLKRLRQAQQDLAIEIRDVGLLPELQLHERTQGGSPYDWARTESSLPIKRLLEVALAASSMQNEDEGTLREAFNDSDAALRWWAVQGALMRGAAGAKTFARELESARADKDALVRLSAHAVAAHFGDPVQRRESFSVLLEFADWSRQHGLIALSALQALAQLKELPAELRAGIAKLPRKGQSPDKRYNSYVPRLIANLLGEEGGAEPAP